jgi:AcrR family transcriptional regulator
MSPRPRIAPLRRAQVVDALRRLMGRKSYGRIGVTEIAREARVARGAINFFFHGKDEILTALLERVIGEYQAALRPLLASPAAADEQLRAVLETLLAPTPAARRMMVVFLNYYALAADDPALAARLRRFFGEYRRLFALLLRRGIRQGIYPRDLAPDQVAALLVAAVEGLLIQWVTDEAAVDMPRAVTAIERLLPAPAPRARGRRSR